MNRVPSRQGARSTVSVFVGRLDAQAKDETLKELFKDCGEIIQVHIQRSGSGTLPFTYGFVRFRTRSAAEKAVAQLDGWPVLGFNIRVEMAEESRQAEGLPRLHTKPIATNEEFLNLSRLMYAMAEATRVSEASRDNEVLNPERLLKEISETNPVLVPMISHPARRSLDLDDLDTRFGGAT